MTQAQNERRLERVEEKLDKLTEAVVSIARIEERVNTVLKHHDRFFNRLDKLEARVEDVETKSVLNRNAIRIAERFVWVLITSGISMVFYFGARSGLF
jgi:predicted nuclease with TOPRIM domain